MKTENPVGLWRLALNGLIDRDTKYQFCFLFSAPPGITTGG